MVLNRKVLYLQPKLGYRKQIYIYEEHLDLQVRRFGSCWEFLHFRSSLKVSPLGIIGFKPTSRRFFQCIILVKIILNFYYKESSNSSLPIQVHIVWSFLERTDCFCYRAADFLTFWRYAFRLSFRSSGSLLYHFY